MARPDMRTWRPVALGRRGAVASNHPLATRAGIDVLARGGNAFDAAVAVAAVIAVVEPALNGVGGDGFYLLHEGATGRSTCVHAVGPSARAATLSGFGDHIPSHGPIAAMTPGAVTGWEHIATRYGTKPMTELFAAAIGCAREGFPAGRAFVRDATLMESVLKKDAGCAAIFLPGGAPPTVGATIKNEALARTLTAIAESGSEVLHGGELGRTLAGFCREKGGLITLEDLAAVRAEEVPPLRTTYRGLTILESDRPTMGFALNLELNIAERFDLAKLGFSSADAVHVLVEAKKLAFVERELFAADPRHVEVDMAALLGDATAEKLAARIDMKRAARLEGRPTREGDTTYFCVADGAGNAVSGIQSLAAPFGSCAMDPETGILLNNRMTWFHLEPEHPNVLGPEKYVRNTINPPLALDGDRVRCVWGTPGGDAQVQVNLQTLSAVLDHGCDPQQAMEAPRWTHFQPGTGSYFPHLDSDLLVMEDRFGREVIDELRSRGHVISEVGPLDGSCAASMILRDDDGLLRGGADPRRDGSCEAL